MSDHTKEGLFELVKWVQRLLDENSTLRKRLDMLPMKHSAEITETQRAMMCVRLQNTLDMMGIHTWPNLDLKMTELRRVRNVGEATTQQAKELLNLWKEGII